MKKLYHSVALLFVVLLAIAAAVFLDFDDVSAFSEVLSGFDYAPIAISLSVLVFCIVLEIFLLPYEETSFFKILHPNKSVISDLVVGGFFLLGFLSLIKAFALAGIGTPAKVVQEHGGGGPIASVAGSPVVHFALYLLLVDFINYWYHRIFHEVEFLWQLHKFHHSITDFVIVSGNRVHPLEKLFQRFIAFSPLAFFQAPVDVFFGIWIVIHFVEKMQHSMVAWSWGWFGRNIVFSPIGHRIHHSKAEEHWDKNFGNLFVFWDKLFGTYYEGPNVNREVGVSTNWFNKEGVVYDLMHSIYLSVREFGQSALSGRWRARHRRARSKPVPE